MNAEVSSFMLQLLQLIIINVILSGDNAVVIALACRGLPPERRTVGIVAGAAVAIILRIIFTLVVASLLNLPWLKMVGSILLFWISVKLVTDESGDSEVSEAASVWQAVKIVAIADMIMSLDNVLAIAGIAKESELLVIVGLAISIPMIVFGAQLIIFLIDRFPSVLWIGAAILGFVSGDMLASEEIIKVQLDPLGHSLIAFAQPLIGQIPVLLGKVVLFILEPAKVIGVIGALFVVFLGAFLKKRGGGDEAENPA